MILLLPVVVFATIFFVYLALSAPTESPIDTQLRAYGYDLGGRDLSTPLATRVLSPITEKFGEVVRQVSPFAMQAEIRERLQRAGNPAGVTPDGFLTIKALAVVVVGTFGLGLPLLSGGLSLKSAIIGIVMAGLSWKLPDFWLSQKMDKRATQIQLALPDALDLIVVCVEAGNGLEAAMANVSRKLTGPLGEEFERTLQEISLGKTRREALRDLSKRTRVPDLQAFIAALLQADQLGVSIAQVLRVQADAMRVRRRQRAEEQASKAPVKMLIPLVMLIFPALIIVVLGPTVVKLVGFFASMH